MKTIETQWIKTTLRHDWGKAKIYKTKGGKLALQAFIGYGGDSEPNMTTSTEPRYYSSVQGCFDALIRMRLSANNAGITFEDIKEVLES